MERLDEINAGQKGKEIADYLNGNMQKIYSAISNLEEKIKNLTYYSGATPTVIEDLSVAGVVIAASPESVLLESQPIEQTVNIPITVYCGNKTLKYTGADNGSDTFALDLGTTVIYDPDSHVKYATMSASNNGTNLVITATIASSIVGSFKYEFSVVFRGVKYKKTLSFTSIIGNGEDALSIDMTPQTVILTEAFSGDTIPLDNAVTEYSAHFGSNDITSVINVEKVYCCNCDANINFSKRQIVLTSIGVAPEGNAEGVQNYSWTDIDGTQHSENKPTNGYVTLLFTYSASDGQVYQLFKKFSFAVNYLGTFKKSIVNDINTQVSTKIRQDLNNEGLLLTEEQKTEIFQDAERIALSAATISSSGAFESYFSLTSDQIGTLMTDIAGNTSSLQQTAELLQSTISDVSGNTSTIQQQADIISLITSGLTKTGIEIDSSSGGTINLMAGHVNIVNSSGETVAAFNEEGGFSTEVIEASHISAKTINVSGHTVDGKVQYVKMTSDGGLSASRAKFENVIITGDFNQPFIEVDDFMAGNPSNNFNIPRGNYISSSGSYPDDCLTWDISQSGKKIVMSMYAYGGQYVNTGTVTLNVPASKTNMYFYEDGIKKKSINLSREFCELIGLSTQQTFLGYLVLKRSDIVTDSRYGHNLKCLAMGYVSWNDSTSPSLRGLTFDGTKVDLKVSAIEGKAGCVHLEWSTSWFSDYSHNIYVGVMCTGLGRAEGNTVHPVSACVFERNANYANICVTDPITNKNTPGSFQFMIFNMNDWSTLNGVLNGSGDQF